MDVTKKNLKVKKCLEYSGSKEYVKILCEIIARVFVKNFLKYFSNFFLSFKIVFFRHFLFGKHVYLYM